MSINLLPWREMLVYEKKKRLFLEMIFSLLATLFVFVLLQTFNLYQLNRLQVAFTSLQKSALIIHKNYQTFLADKRREIQNQAQIQFLQKKISDFRKITALLKGIRDTIPVSIYLTQIEWEKNHFTLDGRANAHTDIALFLKHLDKIMQQKQPAVSETKVYHSNEWGVDFHISYDIPELFSKLY